MNYKDIKELEYVTGYEGMKLKETSTALLYWKIKHGKDNLTTIDRPLRILNDESFKKLRIKRKHNGQKNKKSDSDGS